MDNMELIRQIMQDPGIAKQVLAYLSQSQAQLQSPEMPQIDMPTYQPPDMADPGLTPAGMTTPMVGPNTVQPAGANISSPQIQQAIDSGSLTQPQGAPKLPEAQINELIRKYFPPEQWANAQAVMMGESGGRANAVGDNFPIRGQTIPSYGLFQIRALPGRPAPEQLTDPDFNVKYAADMWKKQGWGPWTAARKLGIK